MKQFETQIYEEIPPFSSCLFYTENRPKDESFLDMIRCTFMPFLKTNTLTFFWAIIISFVFIYSLILDSKKKMNNDTSEFLKITQNALFEMGENYPYYIKKKYHYYRILTSLVVFRNFYHFLITLLGLISYGSYIEHFIGFKRMFLLTITTGIGGVMIRNIFVTHPSLESLTPVCGLIGYLCGMYVAYKDNLWRYFSSEKYHMLILMVVSLGFYFHLGITYQNISVISMAAGFILGLLFYFSDPAQHLKKWRICSIILLVGIFSVAVLYFLLKLNPSKIAI